MTAEIYYQVEESTNGGEYSRLYEDRLTLEQGMARLLRQRTKETKRARRSETGHMIWQYRLVQVTETREVVKEADAHAEAN
jgi:hypothetical protein